MKRGAGYKGHAIVGMLQIKSGDSSDHCTSSEGQGSRNGEKPKVKGQSSNNIESEDRDEYTGTNLATGSVESDDVDTRNDRIVEQACERRPEEKNLMNNETLHDQRLRREVSTEDNQSNSSEMQTVGSSDNSVGNASENPLSAQDQSEYGSVGGRSSNGDHGRVGRETSTDTEGTSVESKHNQNSIGNRGNIEAAFNGSSSGSPIGGDATDFDGNCINREDSSSQESTRSEGKTGSSYLSGTASVMLDRNSQSSTQSPDGNTVANRRMCDRARDSEGSIEGSSGSSETQTRPSLAGTRSEEAQSMADTADNVRYESAQSNKEAKKSSKGKQFKEMKKSGATKAPARARNSRSTSDDTPADDAETPANTPQGYIGQQSKGTGKTKTKGKANRRTNSELKRSYVCEYDRCGRKYASKHARHLHYRIKHSQDSVFNNLRGSQAVTQQPIPPPPPPAPQITHGPRPIYVVAQPPVVPPMQGVPIVTPMQGQNGVVQMQGQPGRIIQMHGHRPLAMRASSDGDKFTQTVGQQMMLVMLPDGTQQLLPMEHFQQGIQQAPMQVAHWQTAGSSSPCVDHDSLSNKGPPNERPSLTSDTHGSKPLRRPPPAIEVECPTMNHVAQGESGARLHVSHESFGRHSPTVQQPLPEQNENIKAEHTSLSVTHNQPPCAAHGGTSPADGNPARHVMGAHVRRRDMDRFHSPASRYTSGISGRSKNRKTEVVVPSPGLHGNFHHLEGCSGGSDVPNHNGVSQVMQNGYLQQHHQHTEGCEIHSQGVPRMATPNGSHTPSVLESYRSPAASNSPDLNKLLSSPADESRTHIYQKEQSNTMRTRSLGYTQSGPTMSQSLEIANNKMDSGSNTGNWVANGQIYPDAQQHSTGPPARGREHYTFQTQMHQQNQQNIGMIKQPPNAIPVFEDHGALGEVCDDKLHARKRSHSHPRNRSPRSAQRSNRKLSPQNQMPPPRHRQKGNSCEIDMQCPNTANRFYTQPKQSGPSCAMHGHDDQVADWNQGHVLNGSGSNGSADVGGNNSTLDTNAYRYNNGWGNLKATPPAGGVGDYNGQSISFSINGIMHSKHNGNSNHHTNYGQQQLQRSSSESSSGEGSSCPSQECTEHGNSSGNTNSGGNDGRNYSYNMKVYNDKSGGVSNAYEVSNSCDTATVNSTGYSQRFTGFS